jgi:hypothetical protein
MLLVAARKLHACDGITAVDFLLNFLKNLDGNVLLNATLIFASLLCLNYRTQNLSR